MSTPNFVWHIKNPLTFNCHPHVLLGVQIVNPISRSSSQKLILVVLCGLC